MDMPPSNPKSMSVDVDEALRPIEKELQIAIDKLKTLTADKSKAVHASDLKPVRG